MGKFHVGFKFVFDVSRCDEPRLTYIFVDGEDLMWFAPRFLRVQICHCNFFGIKSLFVEIDDGFMLRRLVLTNVGDWNRFLSVGSKVGLFG